MGDTLDKPLVIGIDLGTTLSSVAVFRDGEMSLVENDLGDVLTPSVVAFDEKTKTMRVGRIAKDILAVRPDLAAANFKREMGRDHVFGLGSRKMSPIELSAYVLDSLRVDVERALGTSVTNCVVTVPAYFDEAQRFATKQAAQMAGFKVERILNEPTAAAILYGLHKGEEQRRFLVFDLGGGTFDVCVMELFEGLLQVKSVAGESRLGGEDFTLTLARQVLSRLGLEEHLMLDRNRQWTAAVLKRAEILKRKLSRWPSASILIPEPEGPLEEGTSVEIKAEEAEKWYEPLLARMVGPCRAALRGVELIPYDLDEILLVGGAVRMPCVRRFAEELFKRKPIMDEHPDRVVVKGAAIQAALYAEDSAVQDIVVTDVLSHSLGVEVTRTIGTKEVDGYFLPIIHRNTVIPTSRTERLGTIFDGQKRVDLSVYEGDARRVRDNTLIGRLKVSGIPKGPPREVIDVTFSYDMDGILEVEVRVLGTKKVFSEIFVRSQKKLTEEEIQKARDRIRMLKADPGERPRYRDLMGRAELLWTEASQERREILGDAMASFEAALQTRTPGIMEEAYDTLVSICEMIDEGERW